MASARWARVGMRVGQPIGEVDAALLDHRERLEPTADLGAAGRGIQIAGERDHPRGHRRIRRGVQRVEQCRGGDLGCQLVADGRGQPRLRFSRLRRLGDHQQRHREGVHEITFQKSRIAVILPRSEPLTFELPPVRGP